MPRYYKERIYNSEQAGWLKGVMEKVGKQAEEKMRKTYGEKTDHLLAQMHIQSFKTMYKNAKNGTSI